jgi:hypothetical protein
MTTRGLMIAVAAVGLMLDIILEAPWIVVLVVMCILVTLPQTLIVAACADLAIRDGDARPAAERQGRS